ncbi:hypothetical protein D3C83_281740 [compost metagenome]
MGPHPGDEQGIVAVSDRHLGRLAGLAGADAEPEIDHRQGDGDDQRCNQWHGPLLLSGHAAVLATEAQ